MRDNLRPYVLCAPAFAAQPLAQPAAECGVAYQPTSLFSGNPLRDGGPAVNTTSAIKRQRVLQPLSKATAAAAAVRLGGGTGQTAAHQTTTRQALQQAASAANSTAAVVHSSNSQAAAKHDLAAVQPGGQLGRRQREQPSAAMQDAWQQAALPALDLSLQAFLLAQRQCSHAAASTSAPALPAVPRQPHAVEDGGTATDSWASMLPSFSHPDSIDTSLSAAVRQCLDAARAATACANGGGTGSRAAVRRLAQPSVVVGYQEDWLHTSPAALQWWEKASFEPYASPKTVLYYVICADAHVDAARAFVRDLTTVYEACNLGSHAPAPSLGTSGCFISAPAASSATPAAGVGSEDAEFMQACAAALEALRSNLLDCPPQLRYHRSGLEEPWEAEVVVYILPPSPEPEGPALALLQAAAALSPAAPPTQTAAQALRAAPAVTTSASGATDGRDGLAARDPSAEGDSGSGITPTKYGGAAHRTYSMAHSSSTHLRPPPSNSISKPEAANITLQVVSRRVLADITGASLRALAFSLYSKIRRKPLGSALGPTPAAGPAGSGGSSAPDAARQQVAHLHEPLFILSAPGGRAHPTTTPASHHEGNGGEGVGDVEPQALALHCCCAWEPDARWVALAWTDGRGELQETCLLPAPATAHQDPAATEALCTAVLQQCFKVMRLANKAAINRCRLQQLVISCLGAPCQHEPAAWAAALHATLKPSSPAPQDGGSAPALALDEAAASAPPPALRSVAVVAVEALPPCRLATSWDCAAGPYLVRHPPNGTPGEAASVVWTPPAAGWLLPGEVDTIRELRLRLLHHQACSRAGQSPRTPLSMGIEEQCRSPSAAVDEAASPPTMDLESSPEPGPPAIPPSPTAITPLPSPRPVPPSSPDSMSDPMALTFSPELPLPAASPQPSPPPLPPPQPPTGLPPPPLAPPLGPLQPPYRPAGLPPPAYMAAHQPPWGPPPGAAAPMQRGPRPPPGLSYQPPRPPPPYGAPPPHARPVLPPPRPPPGPPPPPACPPYPAPPQAPASAGPAMPAPVKMQGASQPASKAAQPPNALTTPPALALNSATLVMLQANGSHAEARQAAPSPDTPSLQQQLPDASASSTPPSDDDVLSQVAEELHGLAVLNAAHQALVLAAPAALSGTGLGWWGWAPPDAHLPLHCGIAQRLFTLASHATTSTSSGNGGSLVMDKGA